MEMCWKEYLTVAANSPTRETLSSSSTLKSHTQDNTDGVGGGDKVEGWQQIIM